MHTAIPALTILDQSILTAAQNFTSNLWDAYGAPRRKTTEEIAELIGSDQVDVHYAMKSLKRKGHLDHSGVVMNPVPPTTAEGFFSVQDLMRNMSATPIELETVEDSPCEEAINSALKTFCAATELGYEYVSPECYSPQDVARLTTRQTMTAQELSQASETMFFAASTMAAYLDQCWVKLGAKTPDRWTGRIEECRVEFQKFLSEFTRPMANTDIDLVRNVLLGLLRELERLTERALRDLSNQKSPTIPPQMPSPVQTHIDALKKAIEQHIPLDSAFEIVPALQCELARRMESTNAAGFPDKLTEKSLHGIVGDFVAASLDFTEADENALAYQFIVAVGNLFGVGSYASFGADRHYPNLFQLIVGPTSAGKGQSLSAVRSCLSLVDSAWLDRLKHSAASGEALVRMVSEAEDDPRMLVVLSEMSVLLNSSNRDGSNLSGYLRMAYDGAPLEHNRAQKSYRATDYLLSTIGHITPQELSETMANVDWYNGSTNRFLFAACKKSKTLPRMSAAPDFHKIAERIRKLLALPPAGKVDFSAEGGKAWDRWVYTLIEPSDGKLAAAVERSKPNALRVALIYALLDEDRLDSVFEDTCSIEERHVEAAIELVNRSRQSVKWFLESCGNHDSKAGYEDIYKVKAAVNSYGGVLTGTQLAKLFSRKSLEERNELATRAGLKIRKVSADKTGPPITQWTW